MGDSLIGIIPGAKTTWRSLRLALLIVALFPLGASWLLSHTSNYLWLTCLAFASMLINILYVALIMYITRLSIKLCQSRVLYVLAYIMLTISSIPALLMLLCSLDYSLFELLRWYIVLDINKLILPIAAFIFWGVTYWLPVKEIIEIQNRLKHYISIKISNGKQ